MTQAQIETPETVPVLDSTILEQKYFCNKVGEVFCIDIMASNSGTWQDEKAPDWEEIPQPLALTMVTPPDTYHVWDAVKKQWQTNDELQAQKLQDWRATVAEITPKQLRLVLLENGVNSKAVETAIATIEDETIREVATIEWQYATGYQRNNVNLIMIATELLGFDDLKIDAMWQSALLK